MTNTYFRPTTLPQALEILKEHGARLAPIAGCTDLSVAREEKTLDKHAYLDLSFIESLKGITEGDGYITVGAMATHAEISESPVIMRKASILAQACLTIGSPLIRNRGTMGGNVSHASPSGDSIPALYVLNAEMCLDSTKGPKWVPAVSYFKGPGKTVRSQDQLLTAMRFRPAPGYLHIYQKLGQRKALACSKASLAFVAKADTGEMLDVRIACGAVAPTVVRCPRTEKFLEGKRVDEELIVKAKELIISEVTPISDLRSTKEYRKEVMGELLEKALRRVALVQPAYKKKSA